MKTLLKNGIVIDVFTGEKRPADVLINGGRIAGVGRYAADDADTVRDVGGRYLCPGFIDGHIHIESTMLTPAEFANACVPHGTTSVVADPHEIANVCGAAGIRYMLSAGDGLPLTVYVVLPSCVPATPFCESGARLEAADLRPFYRHPRVLGLGEVMNYAGVVGRDKALLEKIRDALRRGRVVNGHAPLLSGRALDAYIAAGIGDDHECTSADEAFERIRKGQCVMIRQGTAAKNLGALLPLFDEPWARRCMLVSDDKHPADLLREGHIDAIVRPAYNEIPKFIEELAELDQREPMPLDVQLTRISEELLKAFDKYGREILILCDKCASTRYDDFFEKLVACVNRVVLRKIYTDPTDDDKLFCEFIAQAFLNSLLDVLRKGLTREQMTEMVHRLLVFYFEKIEDRI